MRRLHGADRRTGDALLRHPVEAAAGAAITTIEAVEADPVGRKVVEAWVTHQVAQCGYCQSGQVMAATALLKQSPARPMPRSRQR